jgi:hypothetical protein
VGGRNIINDSFGNGGKKERKKGRKREVYFVKELFDF